MHQRTFNCLVETLGQIEEDKDANLAAQVLPHDIAGRFQPDSGCQTKSELRVLNVTKTVGNALAAIGGGS
jgi:hypothetical protein